MAGGLEHLSGLQAPLLRIESTEYEFSDRATHAKITALVGGLILIAALGFIFLANLNSKYPNHTICPIAHR